MARAYSIPMSQSPLDIIEDAVADLEREPTFNLTQDAARERWDDTAALDNYSRLHPFEDVVEGVCDEMEAQAAFDSYRRPKPFSDLASAGYRRAGLEVSRMFPS